MNAWLKAYVSRVGPTASALMKWRVQCQAFRLCNFASERVSGSIACGLADRSFQPSTLKMQVALLGPALQLASESSVYVYIRGDSRMDIQNPIVRSKLGHRLGQRSCAVASLPACQATRLQVLGP